MILPRFQFLEPRTLEEVHQTARKYANAVLIAGGTDLLVNLKKKITKPEVLISLGKVNSLRRINYSEIEGLLIGSMVTIGELEENALIREKAPLLAIAAGKLGSPQIRNRATLGGNICTARPAGDTIGPLMAYGAELLLIKGRESRWVSLSDFIKGPGNTTIQEGEILATVKIRPFASNTGVSYIKYGVRKAMEIAMVSITAAVTLEGNKCKSASIVMGAVAPTFIRCREAEKFLCAKGVTDSTIGKAAELASNYCMPITDIRASAEYRRNLVKALTRRGLKEAASHCSNVS